MKTVLINDTDGRENIGCRLTSSTLKHEICSFFSKEIEGFILNPHPWRFGKGANREEVWENSRHWIKQTDETIRWNNFIEWLYDLSVEEYGKKTTDESLMSDVAIFQPEGSISDNTNIVNIVNLLSLPLLLIIKNTPLVVLNGTFPLFYDKRYDVISTFLSLCSVVALRDRFSANHYGVRFMPDSAVMYQPTTEVSKEVFRRSEYLLITTGAQYSKEMNLALAKIALKTCRELGLKPLVITKDYKHLFPLNKEICQLNGLTVSDISVSEASKWLSMCKIHIGGRYHMALFCLSHGVPSVLVPVNTHKNAWLSHEFKGIEMINSIEKIPVATQWLINHVGHSYEELANSLNSAQITFQKEMKDIVERVNVIGKIKTTQDGYKNMKKIISHISISDIHNAKKTYKKKKKHKLYKIFRNPFKFIKTKMKYF